MLLIDSDPTPVPVQDPIGGFTTWRKFTNDDMAYLYVYNTTVEIRTEFRQQNMAFFEEYMGYLARDFLSIFPGLYLLIYCVVY
jgi:hypothetical protein